jgi:hypothetical protein
VAPAVFNTALAGHLAGLGAKFAARSVDAERRALVREHFEDTLASKIGAPVNEALTQANPVGEVKVTVTRYQIQAADKFYVPYEGANAKIKGEFPNGFLPSYSSGLAYKGKNAAGDLNSTA